MTPPQGITFCDTPHGRIARYVIPPAGPESEALFESLPAEEKEHAKAFGELRRRTFAAGRFVLRAALSEQGLVVPEVILRDARGAPILPAGVRASITHTNDEACALVASAALPGHVGIDLEAIDRAGRLKASLILTDNELDAIPEEDGEVRGLELALKFSLKEALYKALDPFVRRWVGFKEVEAWIEGSGRAELELNLKPGEGPFRADGHWERHGSLVLTTANVSLVDR